MIKDIETPEPHGYLIGILKGLTVTLRHLLRHDTATIQYPEVRREYSERFRGTHILTRWENGDPKCTSCYMCQTICPAECITIIAGEAPSPEIEKRPESFEIDLLRCVMCGLCVEACPKEAIIMSRECETAVMSRIETVYTMEQLMRRASLADVKLGFRPYFSSLHASGKPVCVGAGQSGGFIPSHRKIAE